MRKRFQKMWSLLLTVCLLLSLVPATGAVAAAGVTIDKDTANIAPNGTVTLTATTSLSNYTLSWSSSNTEIATVTSTGANTCRVTGVRSGVATVTATLNDGSKDTCTIYVSITNGVYFIRYSSGLYLSVDQGMVEGSQLELLAKKSSGPAQLRQLWKIEHAGQHYYTIRSAYRPDLALNVTNGAVDVAALSTSTPANSALANRKWKISRTSNTYTLNHMGYASRAMQPASTTVTSGTDVIAASDSSTQHTWALEWATISNQVLLINTETGLPATNAVREVSAGETLSLNDLNLMAVFISKNTNAQNISWEAENPEVVNVNSGNGTIQGITPSSSTTIYARREYNDVIYEKSYTVNVTPSEDNVSSGFDNAITIQSGSSASVNISTANQRNYFQFVPNKTGTYIIQSSNPTGDPRVWIYDSKQTLLENDNNSGGNLNFRLSRTLTANRRYYIAAGHSASQTGSYTMTILQPAEIENRFYRVHNVGSLLYLDIEGPGNQEFVHQWSYHTDPQSSWLIQKESDSDYYTIRSQYGDNLYVGISSTNTGVNNIRLYSSISDATRWRIYVTNLGMYLLEPKSAMGKVLYAPNSTEGSRMQLAWLGSGNRCQWNLQQYAHTGKTFSAFDVGDSEEDEVALVKAAFDAFGYTDLGTYNNAEIPVSAQLIKDISRYSDIVYINGHGGTRADLRIQNAAGERIGYLCAESSVAGLDTSLPIEEIGAEYKNGSTTITESCWNERTKWVILAQCSQFNDESEGSGSYWNGTNSTGVWAKTMLGDGERLHGFLGYYDDAPPSTNHTSLLIDFLFNTVDMSLIDAWKAAHAGGLGIPDTNWAAMYHVANATDTIDSFTPSTQASATPYIYYERRNPPFNPPNLPSNYASNLTSSTNSSPLLVDNMDLSSAETLCAKLQSKLTMNRLCSLEIDDNNRIIYNNHNNHTGEENLGMNMTDEQIVQSALKQLEELGLSPSGEYRTSISRVQRYLITDTSADLADPEDIEYTVCFYRTYNGIDIISDQEDGIVVSFNKYGLTELQYHWRDLQIVRTQHSKTGVITREQAQRIGRASLYATNSAALSSTDEPASNTWLAYVQVDDEVKCVWVCSTNGGYGNSILIDAITGEQIYM